MLKHHFLTLPSLTNPILHMTNKTILNKITLRVFTDPLLAAIPHLNFITPGPSLLHNHKKQLKTTVKFIKHPIDMSPILAQTIKHK